MKPDWASVAMLDELAAAARTGQLQCLFVVFRTSDGSYGSAFNCADLDDMLFELGSEIIRLRSAPREHACARQGNA